MQDPEDGHLVCNSGLSIFLWQVYARNVPKPRYFLGVFDLNAWYQVSSSASRYPHIRLKKLFK